MFLLNTINKCAQEEAATPWNVTQPNWLIVASGRPCSLACGSMTSYLFCPLRRELGFLH